MSAAWKSMTAQEYLDRERQAEFKSEFYRGEVFAMSGGSPRHSLIAANFIGEARQLLKGKPCNVYTSDLRIKVNPFGLYTYPDASIVCGDLEFDDELNDTVTNPTILIEVLADSTEKYDRGTKSMLYRQIPSLQEIVLISQNAPHAEQYIRQEGGGWLPSVSAVTGYTTQFVNRLCEMTFQHLQWRSRVFRRFDSGGLAHED